MMRFGLQRLGLLDKFDVLEFQRIGTPEKDPNPNSAAQPISASSPKPPMQPQTWVSPPSWANSPCSITLAFTVPWTTAPQSQNHISRSTPALWPQSKLKTSINILEGNGDASTSAGEMRVTSISTTPPPRFEDLERRISYETRGPKDLQSWGPTTRARLGDIVLARSGDKGGNANIGFFIPTQLPSSYKPSSSPLYTESWDWLRSILTIPKLKKMMGESWDETYFVERVEFEGIMAVHFVVYGVLGRGVSGSSRLDAFAKGMGDWLRDCEVEVPVRFLEGKGLGRRNGLEAKL